jgi:pimeloyl-ACP methyl ester carboxylesterase
MERVKSSKFILIGLVTFGVVLAVAFHLVNRSFFGIPGFYVWKAASGTAHESGHAEIDDVEIYYETYGERRTGVRPVLVLHGGTGFIETMHYQIRALAGTRFVVAPDSRGHGRSSDGEGPLHYERMADDMLDLLDRLEIPQADIVGWSDGGIIGLILAMMHPARVGRLVTSGSNYHVDGIASVPPDDLSPEADAMAAARRFYERVAPDPEHWPVFFGKIVHMWRTEPDYRETDIGRISAPVLVVAGEFDSVERSHTDAMAAAIPDARTAIIPGATHFVPLEDPTAFNAAMLEFLDE